MPNEQADSDRLRLLVVAGEASGDLHAAKLIHAIKKIEPGWTFVGMGGKKMLEAGVEVEHSIEDLGAFGMFELIGGFYRHFKILRSILKRVADYDAAILVNYPGFNLRLAKYLKKAGCPVYFYIGPQVWASRKQRVQDIKKYVDKLYIILPFEEALYKKEGVDAEYHGHPFVDWVRSDFDEDELKKEFTIPDGVRTVGLFPGSRKSEINFLLDDMVETAQLIEKGAGPCRFLLAVADTIDPKMIADRITRRSLDINIVVGRNYDVMKASDFLLMASGSATLEAALMTRPMIIMYRIHPLSYFVVIHLLKKSIPYFGLVNWVRGSRLIPEYLNDELIPEEMADEVISVLNDKEKSALIRAELIKIQEQLGKPGVLARIATSLVRHLKG